MTFLRKFFRRNKFFINKKHGAVVNLKPSSRWKKPILFFSGLLIGSILLFAVDRIFTLAEVADFNPETCLGSWQNPENAQGVPENLDNQSESVSFTAENSAVFTKTENQIFCGQFLPNNYDGKGEIKNVGLTLIWGAKNLDEPEIGEVKPQFIEAIESTSTASSTAPVDIPSEGGESSTISHFFRLPFVELAFAQDEGLAIPPSAPTLSEPLVPSLPVAPSEVLAPPADENTTTPTAPVPDSPKEEGKIEGGAKELPPEIIKEEKTEADVNNSEPQIIAATSSEVIGPAIVAPLEPITSSSEEAPTLEFLATSTVSTTPMEVTPPPPPDDNFLEVRYSFDGQTWLPLQKVGPDNFRNLTINLPNVTWEELRKIQVGVFGISNTLQKTPKIYLDGMLLEVQYELAPILPKEEKKIEKTPISDVILPLGLPVVILPDGQMPVSIPDGRENFKGDEPASFDFNLENIPASALAPNTPTDNPPGSTTTPDPISLNGLSGEERGFFANIQETYRGFLSNLRQGRDFFTLGKIAKADAGGSGNGEALTVQNPMIAQVVDGQGKPTNFQPNLLVVNKKLRITFLENERNFKPGRYKLKLWVLGDGAVYYSERSFLWGVLAVNFNKSIYTVGDLAKIGLGVLDSGGHTICDAIIEFNVTTPTGKSIHFSTHDDSITLADSCAPQSVTNEPDYFATLSVLEEGNYQVAGSARIGQGSPLTIDETFQVQEKPIFEVERFGPTRIYPPAVYQVRMAIKANRDFSGVVSEYIPEVFNVVGGGMIVNDNNSSVKTMQWRLEMKQGETQDISYVFKAPDISPEFYRLGPAIFNNWTPGFTAGSSTSPEIISQGDIGSEVFREARSWQIAADAAGEIILLWEEGAIPDGWTCVSCVATDPFFDVFPRASSTYGAASTSQNYFGHTLTFPSFVGDELSISVNVANNVSSANYPASDHQHIFEDGFASSSDIRPSRYALKFIKAATTTLPNGIIGIFDVASSSLPGGWGRYTPPTADYYLVGGSATSTVASPTHTHVLRNSVISTNANNKLRDTGSGVNAAATSHTHTMATGTSAFSSGIDNNRPPFIGVVFGKINATTTLGSGTDGLIAMFDNPGLPSDWLIISTSGSAYSGRFLSASTTFGGTGGSATHNHNGSLTFASGQASASRAVATGATSTQAKAHYHDVTYDVEVTSSLPIFRDVILGKYTAPVVGNTPAISNLVLNGNNSIVLTDGTTTQVLVGFTVTDNDGCADVFTNGGVTTTIYRSSVSGTSTCATDATNCYRVVTTTNSCAGGNSANATATFDVYYFANSTDASSSYAYGASYSADTWKANVEVRDASDNTDATTTPTGVELLSLLAFSKSTSSFSYGTVQPSSTTGAVNQNLSFKNTGNVPADISVPATAMTSGSNTIASSSQCYKNSRRFSIDSSVTFVCLDATRTVATNMNVATAVSSTIGSSWLGANANIPGLSTVLMAGTVSQDGKRIYLLGGKDSVGNPTSSVKTESFTNLLSTQVPFDFFKNIGTLPSAAYSLGATIVTGNNGYDYLYAIGGYVGGVSPVTSSTWYATTTGTVGPGSTWVQASSLPTVRSVMPVLNYNGYIYVIGGFNGVSSGVTEVDYASINYNTGALGSWGTTTVLPTGLYAHAGFVLNNKIYVLGGRKNTSDTTGTSTVIYAPIASDGTIGTWTRTTDLPSPLYYHSVSVKNFMIYVAGGVSNNVATSSVFYAPISYDGTVGNWGVRTALLTARDSHFSAISDYGTDYNTQILVFGGEIGSTATSAVIRSQTITNILTGADTFWGFKVPNGTRSGTYNSTLNFTASTYTYQSPGGI